MSGAAASPWVCECGCLALCSYTILLEMLLLGALPWTTACSILGYFLTFSCLSGLKAFCDAIYTLMILAGSNRGWVLGCTDTAEAFSSLKENSVPNQNSPHINRKEKSSYLELLLKFSISVFPKSIVH